MKIKFQGIIFSETISAEPISRFMVETFRAYGYSFLKLLLPTLLTIQFQSVLTNIRLRYKWEEEHKWFAIMDDGHGMSEAELVQAMRPGRKTPRKKGLHLTWADLG